MLLETARLLKYYPAPLSRRPEALARTALWLANDSVRGLRTSPPAGTFKSYFDGMPEGQVKAFFDVREAGVHFDTTFLDSLLNSRIINLVKGCDTQCDYCYALASGQIRSMPWQWLLEISEKLSAVDTLIPVEHDISFDGDPLRNYHDKLFDKDCGDAAQLINFDFLPTSGFEIGSIGERAAKKIAADRGRYRINVNFSLMSGWARRLETDAYIETMKNVFAILEPSCINAFHDETNFEATRSALEAAGGNKYCHDLCRPHRDGRALFMPEISTLIQPGGTPLNRDVFILDPDGTIRFAAREWNSHKTSVIREFSHGISPSTSLIAGYASILNNLLMTVVKCALDGPISGSP